MYYTVFSATSTKNPSICVEMNKNGNKYSISAWHRGEHRTIERNTLNHYDTATAAFEAMCDKHGMTHIKEVEQTWDASDFG